MWLRPQAFTSWAGKPRSRKQLPQVLLTEKSASEGQVAVLRARAGRHWHGRGPEKLPLRRF